jgi:hypothetical protein
MPTLQLDGGRTFHVADTLLNQPADHVRRYHVALAPETTLGEADEERFQRQTFRPATTDTLAVRQPIDGKEYSSHGKSIAGAGQIAQDYLGKMAQQARMAVFNASPQARALTILVEQVEQQPAGDLSDQGLRDRLSYLLACGLSEAQVQEQHKRVEAELRALIVPYLVTHPEAEAQEIEVARTQQRRVLALCDAMLGVEAPVPTTRTQVTQAVLDLLELATLLTADVSNIHPHIRQRSFDSLCLLLLQEQHAGRLTLLPTPWQKKPNPYLLPLGLFLEHLRAISALLPA